MTSRFIGTLFPRGKGFPIISHHKFVGFCKRIRESPDDPSAIRPESSHISESAPKDINNNVRGPRVPGGCSADRGGGAIKT